MSPDTAPEGAARCLREEAKSHLQQGLVLLIATVLVIGVAAYLLASSPAGVGESLPVGAQIRVPMNLAPDEAARLDDSVFGLQGAPSGLGDLRLPPRIPDQTERPWAAGPSLESMRRCAESGTGVCPPEVVTQALATVSRPGSDGSPCNTVPLGSGESAVGLHALVLSWIPDCRDQAVQRFKDLQRKLDINIKAGNLRAPQSLAAQLYAGFAQAKLSEDPRNPGGAGFLVEIRRLRQQALVLGLAPLQEQPSWGLSLAEIEAEWLMAEARERARQSQGSALAASLKTLVAQSPQVLVQLRSVARLSQGQARLQLAWCTLALRAGVPAGSSEACVGPLSRVVSLPRMHCAMVARLAAIRGTWAVSDSKCSDDRDGAPETSTALVFERLARDHGVWLDVLDQYLHDGGDAEKRRQLRNYLNTYAGRSGNTPRWLLVRQPLVFWGLAGLMVLAVLGAIGLAWAYLVRLPALYRFLPPPLEMDPKGEN